MPSPTSKLVKARHVLREHGWRGLSDLTRGYTRTRLGLQPMSKRRYAKAMSGSMPLPKHLTGAVRLEEILAVDWTIPREFVALTGATGPMTINWVIPPANAGSGGHQNIFRFVSHLEARGHTCRIYVHDPHSVRSSSIHEQIIRENFVEMAAEIAVLDGPMAPADGIIATSWPTAYPVYSDPSSALRFYFVQDFEPLFYPLGSEYVL
ncbi:MAG: glycosyltransferase family 1 protein, partial [Thermoleophilia bacterium]|nr:glycosyltransferase family 1 protein [Thermoleophilia bacterium]